MVPRVTLDVSGGEENFQPLSGIESTDLPVHGHRLLVRNLISVLLLFSVVISSTYCSLTSENFPLRAYFARVVPRYIANYVNKLVLLPRRENCPLCKKTDLCQ
jgi:hypothetical protein